MSPSLGYLNCTRVLCYTSGPGYGLLATCSHPNPAAMIIAAFAFLAFLAGGLSHLDDPMVLTFAALDAKSSETSLVVSQVFSDVWAERTCWRAPVDRQIFDPFRPPECRRCSGNRGVKFAAEPGDEVRSVVTGTVWFHGTVGGTGYLTLLVEGSVVSLPAGFGCCGR